MPWVCFSCPAITVQTSLSSKPDYYNRLLSTCTPVWTPRVILLKHKQHHSSPSLKPCMVSHCMQIQSLPHYPASCYLVWSLPTALPSPHAPCSLANCVPVIVTFILLHRCTKPSGLWTFALWVCTLCLECCPPRSLHGWKCLAIWKGLPSSQQKVTMPPRPNYFLTHYSGLIFLISHHYLKFSCLVA